MSNDTHNDDPSSATYRQPLKAAPLKDIFERHFDDGLDEDREEMREWHNLYNNTSKAALLDLLIQADHRNEHQMHAINLLRVDGMKDKACLAAIESKLIHVMEGGEA